MATTIQPPAIRGAPVTLRLPDLDGSAIEAPATAEAIANYNAMVARLAEAEAALEAADAKVRAAKDTFLDAAAVAVRYHAAAPGRETVADAELRLQTARQYRDVVRRALGDARAELVEAVRAERSAALESMDRQLMHVRRLEAEAIEQLARLRAQRAALHAIRRWVSAFPGTADHLVQFQPATQGRLPELMAPNGEPLSAAAVLDALRADAAR